MTSIMDDSLETQKISQDWTDLYLSAPPLFLGLDLQICARVLAFLETLEDVAIIDPSI